VGGLTGTFAASARLLALAKMRESIDRRRNPFPPLVHLLANMVLCAIAHRYLADDPGGVYLPLFVAVQCLLPLLVTFGFVSGTGTEIVRKTRVLPGSGKAGYYFLVAGSLRRPEFLLVAGVGCLFPAFVYGGGAAGAAGIVAASALPILTVQIACCALAARMIAAGRPLTGIALLPVAVTLAAGASVFVFRSASLASSIPLAGWAATSIAAFADGRTADGLAGLLPLALAGAAAGFIFRK
jgi:hypothetical protein